MLLTIDRHSDGAITFHRTTGGKFNRLIAAPNLRLVQLNRPATPSGCLS